MKFLLDTHIFLWFISGDKQLSASALSYIRNPENEIYLSAASVWEIVVKCQIGKLPLPEPPETFIPEQRQKHQIASLVIDEQTVSYLSTLPTLHRDPFDRILICQALQHNMTIITVDTAITAYPVTTAR